LLAILIGSGSRTLTAVDLAKQILAAYQNNLQILATKQVIELTKFNGIGEAKAINIVSAMELSRRRSDSFIHKKPVISCSSDVYSYLKPQLLDLSHEEFWVIYLKSNNEVIEKYQVSKGGVSGTVVDLKIIFKQAIQNLASGIILSHNHPSGNLKPSQADINLTRKIKHSGEVLDIPILDHLIFTNNGFFSFADESLL
jgi:DNA repair protein RadC